MPDAPTDNAICRTMKLTKIFRDFWLREKVTAVADLDLEIRPGEVFGLLGPNGSGKSTTLKMILGLLFPTRGRITVFGRRPTDVRSKSRIGFLPEESYLYPFLSAEETLDFYGRLFHQPRKQRHGRTGMLLDMVGLSAVAHRRVGEYSKGMQRRIGLAQALINDPDLLILDEPTAGMDPIGSRQFKDLIRTLAQRGKTVILSSHLLADVEDVCDRVCILYGGRQMARGDIADLLARQDRTQITTDALDARTLDRLREVVGASGKTIHSVTAPRDKLETLFIRIVDEAQRRKVSTGGAVQTGEVAEFLRTGARQGEQVIEKLVSASSAEAVVETPSEPPSSALEPARAQPSEEVLGELTRPEETSEQQQQPERPEQAAGERPDSDKARRPAGPARPRAKQDQADKSVIEELTGERRDDQGGS